jgi:hypothetical protein
MEKIIISKSGFIVFDTETNVVRRPIDLYFTNRVARVDKGGQVITDDEIIDVEPNSYVTVFTAYDEAGYAKDKVIVISDPATVHDLDEFYTETKEGSRDFKQKVTCDNDLKCDPA